MSCAIWRKSVGSLSKLEKIDCDLTKIIDAPCKLGDSESSRDIARNSVDEVAAMSPSSRR